MFQQAGTVGAGDPVKSSLESGSQAGRRRCFAQALLWLKDELNMRVPTQTAALRIGCWRIPPERASISVGAAAPSDRFLLHHLLGLTAA